MSYELGAAKYLLMAFVYPVNYYIFGGTLLWILDVVDIIGADNLNDLTLAYVAAVYGIPTSVGDALLQLGVGATVATLLWYLAVRTRT